LRPLRADIDVVYQVRRDLACATRHELAAGVVTARARTRQGCKLELANAVRNHLSALPSLRWGRRTGAAYLLFPVGADWRVQCAMPGKPAEDVGTLTGCGEAEATAALERMLAKAEATTPTKTPMTAADIPAAWRPRPSARAPRKEVYGRNDEVAGSDVGARGPA
jgi:hypothetical protein